MELPFAYGNSVTKSFDGEPTSFFQEVLAEFQEGQQLILFLKNLNLNETVKKNYTNHTLNIIKFVEQYDGTDENLCS